jgi:2-polyprenyl-3-methyl-5-hydroxy-6-metoxy-1,4-benzoquinol methylase
MPEKFEKWSDYYAIKDPGYKIYITSPVITELLAKVANYGETFIEWGYGTGHSAVALANRGKFVTAYDPDSGLLERANASREANLKTQKGIVKFTDSIEDLAPADAVYSQGLLEHFEDEKIVEILGQQLEFAQVAVVFSVPSKEYPSIDFGNERLMTVAEWERILTPFAPKLTQLYRYERNQQIMGVIRK